MQSLCNRQCAVRSAARPARSALVVTNAAVAQPATLPLKGVDGSDKGTQQLALRVAEESAKGLVHRYLVLVQQNARRVRKNIEDRLRTFLGAQRCRGLGLPAAALEPQTVT